MWGVLLGKLRIGGLNIYASDFQKLIYGLSRAICGGNNDEFFTGLWEGHQRTVAKHNEKARITFTV